MYNVAPCNPLFQLIESLLPYDLYAYGICCFRGWQDTAIAIDDTDEEEDDGLAGQGPSAGPHSVAAGDAPGPALPTGMAAAAVAAAAAAGDCGKLAGAGAGRETAEGSGRGAEGDDGDVQMVDGGPEARRSARLKEVAALELGGEEGGAAKPVKDSELFKVRRRTHGCERCSLGKLHCGSGGGKGLVLGGGGRSGKACKGL